MKGYVALAVTLALALSACGAETPAPSTDQIVSAIYTQAAQTLIALSTAASSPTHLPVPTSTPTPIPTLIPPTATLTPVICQSMPMEAHPVYMTWKPDADVLVDYALCNSSAFYEDVTVLDGTVFSPGESFEKIWTIQNTGFCAWKSDYQVKFFSGDLMSGADAPLGRYVASGQQAKVSVALTAPALEGTYTGYWILADERGAAFGMPFYVQIVVKNC